MPKLSFLLLVPGSSILSMRPWTGYFLNLHKIARINVVFVLSPWTMMGDSVFSTHDVERILFRCTLPYNRGIKGKITSISCERMRVPLMAYAVDAIWSCFWCAENVYFSKHGVSVNMHLCERGGGAKCKRRRKLSSVLANPMIEPATLRTKLQHSTASL